MLEQFLLSWRAEPDAFNKGGLFECDCSHAQDPIPRPVVSASSFGVQQLCSTAQDARILVERWRSVCRFLAFPARLTLETQDSAMKCSMEATALQNDSPASIPFRMAMPLYS